MYWVQGNLEDSIAAVILGSHIWSRVIVPSDFFTAKPVSMRELPFLLGLNHNNGYRRVNHT